MLRTAERRRVSAVALGLGILHAAACHPTTVDKAAPEAITVSATVPTAAGGTVHVVRGRSSPASTSSTPASPEFGPSVEIAAIAAKKIRNTPIENKIDSALLHEIRRLRAEPTARSRVRVAEDGTVTVDITAVVDAALLQRIQDLGGTVLSSVPRFDAVQARIPIHELEALAREPAVRAIRGTLGFVTNHPDGATVGAPAEIPDASQ